MPIASVRVKLKGKWYDLHYNPDTGNYEAELPTPRIPRDYPIEIEAIDTAGNNVTKDICDPELGDKLIVKVRKPQSR